MAVRLDSISDFLYTTTGAPTTADHTLMLWFRINTDRNALGAIAVVANATATEFWALQLASDGTTLRTSLTGNTQDIQALTAGTWYHLCSVRSGTSNLNYVNGALVTTHGPVAGADFTPGIIYLGSDTTIYVDGDFCAVKTFNAALTAEQVAQEMNVTRPVNLDVLRGWYPMFPGGTGEWGRDYSGNGLNLSEAGTPANADSPPVSWGAPVWVVPWLDTGAPAGITGTADLAWGGLALDAATGTVAGIGHVGTTNWSTTAGSAVSFAMPAGVATGDLLVVFINSEQATTGRTFTFGQDNTGWAANRIVHVFSGAQAVQGDVWWHWIDGTNITTGTTVTATANASDEYSGVMMVFRNVDTSAPFSAVTSAGPGTSGDAVADAKTGLNTTDWVLFGAASAYGTTWTPPANWIEVADNRSGSASTNTSLAVCFRTGVTSTAADTYDGATNDFWIEWTAVLKNAPSGPVGTANLAWTALTITAAGTVDVAGTGIHAPAALALAAAGTVAVQGSASLSFGALPATGAGGVEVRGSADLAFAAFAPAGAGTVSTVESVGSASLTWGALALSATGAVAVQGAAALTWAAFAPLSTGGVEVRGSAPLTLAAFAPSATGTVEVRGAAALAFGALTIGAAGVVGNAPATGDAALEWAALAITSAGTVAVAGASTPAFGALATTAAGTVAVAGTAALAFSALTVTAAGVIGAAPVTGDANLVWSTFAPAGAGKVAIAGSAALAWAALPALSAGTVQVRGTAALSFGALAITAMGVAGFTPITGSAALTWNAITPAGAGTVAAQGVATLLWTSFAPAGAGGIEVAGAASFVWGALASDAQAGVEIHGGATLAWAALTVQGTIYLGTILVAIVHVVVQGPGRTGSAVGVGRSGSVQGAGRNGKVSSGRSRGGF